MTLYPRPLPFLHRARTWLTSPVPLFQSRLSKRIALSVFGSIVAIETILLVPSVFRHEQALLTQLQDQSAASLTTLTTDLANAPQSPSPSQLLTRLQSLESLPFIAGGTLYHRNGPLAGQAIGSFGTPPLLRYDQLNLQQQGQAFHRRHRRYDNAWASSIINDYLIIICHDTTGLRQALIGFIGRIFLLVLIISTVVTLATLLTLRPLLIRPILALRHDLEEAASAALKHEPGQMHRFTSLHYSRNDELGDVIAAFQAMFENIARAIAHRRQAERSLRESESRFRTLVNQAAESIMVLDSEGKIIEINNFALRHLQYSHAEAESLSIFNIDPELTSHAYRQQWQQLQQDNPLTFETTYRQKPGQCYPVEVRSSLIRKHGKQQALYLARNISDRQKAQAAQARLAEIGELAAMIVHEVRNPLSTIYVALTGFKRLDLPQVGQLRLTLALEEAERLKRLLNEILTYSKDSHLQTEATDLNDFCQHLHLTLQGMPAAHQRQINLVSSPDMLLVQCDRDKLKQVFINLITNACEAIEPGEAVQWELSAPCPEQIQITIQNGGDPIPPEVLPKLTKPFISTKASGNGLGLAITKRIIQAHKGNLTLTSDATTGTTVTVKLPGTTLACSSTPAASTASSEPLPSTTQSAPSQSVGFAAHPPASKDPETPLGALSSGIFQDVK